MMAETKAWDKAIEIVKDYAKMTVDGFREKYGIKTDRFGWIEVVAAIEAVRTEEAGEGYKRGIEDAANAIERGARQVRSERGRINAEGVEFLASEIRALVGTDGTCDECAAENHWHRTACSRHPRFVVA